MPEDMHMRGKVAAHAMLHEPCAAGGICGGRVIAVPFEVEHTMLILRNGSGETEVMVTNEEAEWFAGYLLTVARRGSLPRVKVPTDSSITPPLHIADEGDEA